MIDSLNDESWKYKFFFMQLAHPAFISSYVNNELQVTFVNRKLRNLLPGKLDQLTTTTLFLSLFQDHQISQDYKQCIELIASNSKSENKINIGYLTLMLDKSNIKKKNLIYCEKVEGLASKLVENNQNLYFDLFSIPQYKDSKITGFQAVLPIVNRRKNEYNRFLSQSKRNQKLDNAVYGLSHVIGSHQIPDAQKFLGKLADKLMDIDKKIIFSDREGLKNYYTKQFNNYQSFLSDVMLATHKINQPFSNIVFSSFNTKNIKDSLESIFSVIEGDTLSYINIIGRGIMDGAAEGVVSFKNSFLDKEIELPSSNGESFLVIFIINYLRNLYKHSVPRYVKSNFDNKNYIKDLPNISDYEVDRKVYQAQLSINEIEDDSILKLYYYRLDLFNLSRYKSEIHDNRNLEEIVLELNSYVNNYRDEKSYKGLKEMRTLASALIAMPLEDIEISQLNDELTTYILTADGQVFPRKIMEYKVVKGKICLSIFLRKKKFATIWVDDLSNFSGHVIKYLNNEGVYLKDISQKKSLQSSSDFVVDATFKNHFNKNENHFNRLVTSKYRNFRFISLENDDILKKLKYNDFSENYIKEEIKKLICTIKTKWCDFLPKINPIYYADSQNYGDKKLLRLPESKIVEDVQEFKNVLITSHYNFFKKNQNPKKYWDKWNYVESESSKSGGGDLIHDGELYKQLEAIHTNVYIYDEVLQEVKNNFVNNDSDPELKQCLFRDTLIKKGIFIPTKEEINMIDWFTGDKIGKTVDDFQSKLMDNVLNPSDKNSLRYIIIHYSGFEKLVSRKFQSYTIKEMIDYLDSKNLDFDRNSNSEKLYELILINEFERFAKLYKDTPTYVVFMSGKNPSSLDKNNVLFVNRNVVENIITKQNSKYSLVSLLNSLRFKKL